MISRTERDRIGGLATRRAGKYSSATALVVCVATAQDLVRSSEDEEIW
jgi:hypothetical protein